MDNFECILFDCMETLVDLHKLPAFRDYALWAYEGSGVEELWEDFDEFFRYYILAKQELSSRLPEHADYEMLGRFLHIVRVSLPDLPYEMMEATAEKLYRNYWRNYRAGSYVREDVRRVLGELSGSCRMGVVSNFMVMNGIEELLELHGIRNCFDFVITSVAEGWRKPHPAIYNKAIELSGAIPERILFVGDDFVNDYEMPLKIGMKPVFLDRYGRHPEAESRVNDFYGLRDRIRNQPKE